MNLKKMREYWELGVISGFQAVRDPMKPDHWILSIQGKAGKQWVLMTSTNPASERPRSFSSVDSLLRQICDITGRVQLLNIGV